MAPRVTKIITTGTKFTCFAPESLTQFNKKLNREVHKACYQKPKFKPQASCRGCQYLEVYKDGINK